MTDFIMQCIHQVIVYCGPVRHLTILTSSACVMLETTVKNLVLHSRILYKKHAQVSCTRNLHQILMYKKKLAQESMTHSQVSCTRFLTVCHWHYKTKWWTILTTNKNGLSWKYINRISQFWSHVCKFLAWNRSVFYWMQDSRTRKKLVQEGTTHMHVSCTSWLVQVSCTRSLTVTSIRTDIV